MARSPQFKKRLPLLLLEFLIALLIMGGVLQMLFAGYRHAAGHLEKARLEKELALSKERLFLRLQLLFQSAESCKEVSSNQYLITYQGGVDPDPEFRCLLEGSLRLDQKRLIFVSSPKDRIGKERKEVLLEKTEKISCLFFDPKSGAFSSVFAQPKSRMMKVFVTLSDGSSFILPIFL